MKHKHIILGAGLLLGLASSTVALGQISPVYTLSPSTNLWDGRQTFTVTPVISNLAALQAAGATNFTYQWTVDGVAVIGQTMPDLYSPGVFTNGILTLLRSQGNGPMTVTLALGNGGTPVTNTCIVSVQQPATDAWVARTPDVNETPVNNQFYARDNTGYGTLFYNGTIGGSPSSVFLKVYANGVLYTNLSQVPSGGAYAFAARIQGGLVTYSAQFGSVTSGVTNVLNTVTNLVCGDAYILEGQSNTQTPIGSELQFSPSIYTNSWIRSYGVLGYGASDGVASATNGGWGYATRQDTQPQIGYWGMDLASNLWATYNMPICIINGAVGGTMILQHQANRADHSASISIPTVGTNGYSTASTIYANLLARVRAARLTHGIRGVLWHQGEQNQGTQEGLGYPDYLTYQKYFVNLSAAWKQDFPNIRNYYIFQIWPAACGDVGNCDMLREAQRTLPRLYSNMRIMSTLGVVPKSGCHYVPAGYQRFSDLMSPLVQQDNYGYVPAGDITAPDLKQAYYTTTNKNEIALVFSQGMTCGVTGLNLFFLDYTNINYPGVYGAVTSWSASGNVVKLQLSGSNYQTITYLAGSTYGNAQAWNGNQADLLYGGNGVAALTFCSVPIAPLASASAAIVNLPATGVTANSASLNAALGCVGTNVSVYAYWGGVNGQSNPTLWSNSAYLGAWSNVSLTNLSYTATGLAMNTGYFFTFVATNAGGSLWANNSLGFTTTPPPTKLGIALNSYYLPSGRTFSVTVQALDALGKPLNVTNDTMVQLSKTSGAGTLSGTLSGTIVRGASSVVMSGVVYSGADTMTMSATATSGMSLTAATSLPITFLQFAVTGNLAYTTIVNGSDNVVTTFTGGSGTWAPPPGVSNVSALVVGGGGGGGSARGGGGGAGGVIYSNSFPVSGSVPVTVGSGGQGAVLAPWGAAGTSGSNSVFSILTAIGGGRGGGLGNNWATNYAGSAGGSGGGACYYGGNRSPGAGTTGQGYAGGTESNFGGTGGGGAGAIGGSDSGSGNGGAGGSGITNSISGGPVAYGGGGGGSADDNAGSGVLGGSGGAGGGGKGADASAGTAATAGLASTGGGGGGGNWHTYPDGAAGGSGVVIVKYVYVTSPQMPTKLVFTSVPSSPVAGQPFSVTVQAQDASGNAANVTNATTVQLSRNSGGGTLSGTTNGTIANGTSSVTISGVVYSAADTMTLRAATTSGMSLTVATSGNITFTSGSVAAPTFSPAAGTYTNAQSVTISTTTTGASIRYTTDGSTPTSTSGTVYSSPVNISVTTTLKAIAYKSGMTDSSVTSGTYTISSGGLGYSVVTNGANAIVTFTNGSGTWTPPTGISNVQALVVGGGGGGGGNSGGGGGGGGVIYSNNFAVSGAVAVAVGGGGIGGISGGAAPGMGTNSIFSSLTAQGGGSGASYGSPNDPATSGGSGGGGSWISSAGGGFTAGQGNSGGSMSGGSNGYGGAGGGGAGAVGGSVNNSANGGAGGAGVQNTISGSSQYYGGGGGGGGDKNHTGVGGAGGLGGGGAGGGTGPAPIAGAANTGGGGGGGCNPGGGVNGAAGGSGVVIVSYAIPTGNLAYSTTTNGANTIITFTNGSGTWTPAAGVTNVQVLVVGGGGGGGAARGGGGGAGGVIYSNSFPISGSVSVSVGNGGQGAVFASGGAASTSGSNSIFSTLTAIGGGRGGGVANNWGTNYVGAAGGSGGGACYYGGNRSPGAGTTGQGYAGGTESGYGGTGGGGAWAAGGSDNAGTGKGGAGGNGITNSITGSAVAYGGGGGGSADDNGGSGVLGGPGGAGGGGKGSDGSAGTAATAGSPNTGGGGGAGNLNTYQNGAAGGAGVVIVSYPTSMQGHSVVMPPPADITISGVTISGGLPSFTFSAQVGQWYRLAYKNALTDAEWSHGPWTTNISGNAESMTLVDPDGAAQPQRFYRLEAAGP